jgi:hypothetical protein
MINVGVEETAVTLSSRNCVSRRNGDSTKTMEEKKMYFTWGS